MRASRPLLLACLVGLISCGAAIWHLEAARSGLWITPLEVGSTPATVYRRTDTGKAPAVIIAHGFAGSRQLMEAYALTLAQAGYVAVSFDFEGHGRNPTPMSGDVTRVDGTTRLLESEIGRVTDAVLALPFVDGRVALLGHSMASDIIVRRALEDPRVAATVAISMFSEAVTKTEPRNLLMISRSLGTAFSAKRTLSRTLGSPIPPRTKDETIGNPAAQHRQARSRGAWRRACERSLFAPPRCAEARSWLDAVFGRTSSGPVAGDGRMDRAAYGRHRDSGMAAGPACCHRASRRRCDAAAQDLPHCRIGPRRQ